MSYNTFSVLRDFLNQEKLRVHQEYLIAKNHCQEWAYDGMTSPKFGRGCKVLPQNVLDFLWKNYEKQVHYYEDMLEQLYYAAQESNRKHPNPKMREFWCLEET